MMKKKKSTVKKKKLGVYLKTEIVTPVKLAPFVFCIFIYNIEGCENICLFQFFEIEVTCQEKF